MPSDKYENQEQHEDGTLFIQCSCGMTFAFTPGEQKFYAERGLFPPKRCPMCRLKRKQEHRSDDAQK